MPFEVFLALRYLKSRRRRRLARVTALVAILGIAVGVGALIVALALANGFRDEMREKILRGTSHINGAADHHLYVITITTVDQKDSGVTTPSHNLDGAASLSKGFASQFYWFTPQMLPP